VSPIASSPKPKRLSPAWPACPAWVRASRFRKYLVFYRPISGGIEVLHVLHGARDIAGILAEEFGVKDDADDEADEGE